MDFSMVEKKLKGECKLIFIRPCHYFRWFMRRFLILSWILRFKTVC